MCPGLAGVLWGARRGRAPRLPGHPGAERAPRSARGFDGTIQTDAYEVYEALLRLIPGLHRIGCAAHARRRFHRALREGEAQAIGLIGLFRRLYQQEREGHGLTPENRRAERQAKASPLWVQLPERALVLHPQVLPQSTLGKAVSYLLNEYEGLTGYLGCGRREIDNT